MARTCAFAAAFAVLVTASVAVKLQGDSPSAAEQTAPAAISPHRLSAMPLAFTENRGQWDERVRFRASAGGTTLWFCRDGITYQFTHRVLRQTASGAPPVGQEPRAPDMAAREHEADSIETVVVHAAFVGAGPNLELVGEGQLQYRCNYFLGNDPAKWRTDVPNYGALVYRNAYPGVELRYEGKDGILTCSFTAASESDLGQVKFRYEGNAAVTETGRGQFRVEAPWGAVSKPFSASEGPVPAPSPMATGTASVTLAYSTYLGGGLEDRGDGIAVDGSGSTYVLGYTYSLDFPTVGPYQTDRDGSDFFVTKLNVVGSAVYSTYLGGSNIDAEDGGIAVDGSGNAYVTGTTESTDFPTAGPYQTNQGGLDVFVTKLSAAGNTLVYSTYLGGSGGDNGGSGIAVDGSGNAYVTGSTGSADFPTVAPYQTYQGRADVFVTKLNAAGNTLVYSTYLGGSTSDESGWGIAVDGSRNAYVTGETYSSDFPTVAPYQTDRFGQDAFVTKLLIHA